MLPSSGPKRQNLSHDELVGQFRNLARHQHTHSAKAAEIHEKLKTLLGGKAFADAVATGASASTAGAEIRALEAEASLMDLARKPVSDRIVELVPTIGVEIERRRTELETLHRANGELIFANVKKRVESALGEWLQPAEVRWVALRSRPYREQANHEAAFPASAGISYNRGPHPETGEMTDLPDSSVLDHPEGLCHLLDRLADGIAAAKQRREQLKREFSA